MKGVFSKDRDYPEISTKYRYRFIRRDAIQLRLFSKAGFGFDTAFTFLYLCAKLAAT